MSMTSKIIVLIFNIGFFNFAVLAQTNECPLEEVVANWNMTIDTCVNQAVKNGGDQMCQTVIGIVNDFFEFNNNSMAAWPSSSVEISDAEKSAAFQAYFCVLQSAVQQAPQLGVIAFDCAQDLPPGLTDPCLMEKEIETCFDEQLKESCANMINSRKRRSIIAAVKK